MSYKKNTIFCFVLLLLVTSSSAARQQDKKILFPITQFQLENGLQVILSEDYSLPLVSVVIAYNVGSINEHEGKTGLAFLLENLMFQGSMNIRRMQHYSFIHKIGGELNASTLLDKTLYYQTVLSNQLALVLWLEADRMKSLDINTVNVDRAKNSLIEEIHHRKEFDPYRESSIYFEQLLFPDFSYNHPIIGKEADLRNITMEDANDFYSTYYTPNNAILSIVGNFNARTTKELIQKYFGTIPKGKTIPPVMSPKPSETKGITETHENSLASSPGFHLGYRLAPPHSVDYYPLAVIEYILLRGKSSRLYRRLIKKDRIAFHLSGGIDKRKDLAAFKIFVTSNNEVIKERSQKAVFSEINKLKSNLISQKELRKVKNMLKMDYISQYSTSMDKAIFLAEVFLSKISLDDLPNELDKYLDVTPSDIIGILNRYFTQDRIILDIKIK